MKFVSILFFIFIIDLLLSNSLLLKIYNSISEFAPTQKTIATLGTFDGVHVGHRKIIDRLVSEAKIKNFESVILTFFPHPRMVLGQVDNIKLLNTIDEKSTLLASSGLNNLIIHPFDAEFSQLSAEEFVESILVDRLNISKIIIGYDHRFGKDRTATIDDLIKFGQKYGFEVEQISAEEIDDVAVSSTKIRNALKMGDMELANEFLGYPYQISGSVVHGKKLGRTIGFPTANISISESYKQLPKNGVYLVKSTIDDTSVFGMMNVGENPTIIDKPFSIEVYFFKFDQDLYDRRIQISILHRIRDEHKFESVEDLKKAIRNDQEYAYKYLSEHKL